MRDHILTTGFAVVAFSVFVQGLTMTPLLRRVGEIPQFRGCDVERASGPQRRLAPAKSTLSMVAAEIEAKNVHMPLARPSPTATRCPCASNQRAS